MLLETESVPIERERTCPIRLRILGRFSATAIGASGSFEISAPMRRALLGYLALQPDFRETRERLASLFWGDRPDKQARQNLRQCLLQLRKEFVSGEDDILIVERDVLALNPLLVSVDALEFQTLAQSQTTEDLASALKLYCGPLLEGGELEIDSFDDWLRGERARFAALAAAALERHVALQDAAGHGDGAIRDAERLVRLEPLREEAHRLLLRMLARYRGRDAALSRADELRRLLRIDLGVEPEAETQDLMREIRTRAFPRKVDAGFPQGNATSIESGAFPGKVDAGFPQGNATSIESALPGHGPCDLPVSVDRRSGNRPIEPGAASPLQTGIQGPVAGVTLSDGPVRTNSELRPSVANPPAASPPVANVASGHGRPSARSIFAWAISAAIAAGSLAALALWASGSNFGKASGRATSDVALSPAQVPEISWQPPGVFPGGGVDGSNLASNGIHAVVVLPFTTSAGEQSPDQVLADQITGDLINDLSRIPALRIISRATSRLYGARPVDPARLRAELGVGYVVEGSVQLLDGRVRINVALVHTHSRLQVWANRFERDAVRPFAEQDEIARGIARHLHVNVIAAEDRRRGPQQPADPDISDLLAKGWAGMVQFFEQGATPATLEYFEEVLRRQPNNGSAMLGVAGYSVGVVAAFLVPDEEAYLGRAEELLQRILKVNPSSSMGNYYQALLYKLRGEPNSALAALKKALGSNPSFAPAYANMGHVMSRTGSLDEAKEHVLYAIRLSPKDPSLGIWSLYAGEIDLEQGNLPAAVEWFKRAVALNPRGPFNHAALAATSALGGDHQAASLHMRKVKSLAPWLTLDRIERRLRDLSAEGRKPDRLIEGLGKAFLADR